MSRPQVGVILNRLGGADAAHWRNAIERVEAVGLDHLAVGDHVAFHTGVGADGLLAAATVLGVSERLSTNTAVYHLPLRHSVLVARQLADIGIRAPGTTPTPGPSRKGRPEIFRSRVPIRRRSSRSGPKTTRRRSVSPG